MPVQWEARLDELVRAATRRVRAPGLAIGVAVGGETVFARGVGVLELGKPAPVDTRTVFHMALVTKPFVATAIMQLVESGVVKLDDTAVRHLPYFRMTDARYREITIRQMLNHTAGMPDVADYHWQTPQYDDESLERYIRSLAPLTLLDAPGVRAVYSNIAFEVLAGLIARVSGQPFEDYVEQRILRPIGMADSTLLMLRPMPRHWAAPHTLDGEMNVVVQPFYPYNRPHAASSTLHSSVDDMLRWANANLNRGILGQRILSPDSYTRLWTPSAPLEPLGSVGLSWMLTDRLGRRIVQHGGGDQGFSTLLLLAPDAGVGVVALSNMLYAVGAVTGLAWAGMALALGVEPEPIFPTAETMALMRGCYVSPDGTTIEVDSDGDEMFGALAGVRFRFVPVDPLTVGAEPAFRGTRIAVLARGGTPIVVEGTTVYTKQL